MALPAQGSRPAVDSIQHSLMSGKVALAPVWPWGGASDTLTPPEQGATRAPCQDLGLCVQRAFCANPMARSGDADRDEQLLKLSAKAGRREETESPINSHSLATLAGRSYDADAWR